MKKIIVCVLVIFAGNCAVSHARFALETEAVALVSIKHGLPVDTCASILNTYNRQIGSQFSAPDSIPAATIVKRINLISDQYGVSPKAVAGIVADYELLIQR